MDFLVRYTGLPWLSGDLFHFRMAAALLRLGQWINARSRHILRRLPVAFDLASLTYTPDLRIVPPVQARLVCAMRYTHCARRVRDYSSASLARHLGTERAVHSFHVFMDEVGRSWPEPIELNPPCQPAFSYDEMLLVDLTTAAARNDRQKFDGLVSDMVGESGRNAIWSSARRLMRILIRVVQ